MYDIRQFRPTLYLVLMLGISGFALASLSMGLWVLATAAILLHAWLISSDRFTPMPRLAASVVTLVMFLWAARQFVLGGTTGAVLAIGQFLVMLQIVKLYELRANRDYAQLLVLSLLLMVAALISTASLLFAIILVAYLFIALYCCLLFHLKVEADFAKAALVDSQQKVSPTTLRQDQRYLARSMRRLTGLVSSVSVTAAVLVFLFFPRSSAQGLFGALQFRPSQSLTGFSDEVSFQNIARITQNDEKVAEVFVWKGGKPLMGTETLLLRGVALDVYEGDSPDRGKQWKWSRSVMDRDEVKAGSRTVAPRDSVFHTSVRPAAEAEQIQQKISLHPTGTKALFAVAGPLSFRPARTVGGYLFVDEDQTMQTGDPLYTSLEYTVVSSGVVASTLGAEARNAAREVSDIVNGRTPASGGSTGAATLASRIDPKIRDFAQRTDVSGSDAEGALAARRGNGRISDLDETIALNIESYLQKNYTYTLDLSDARRIVYGQDPLVAFLYDLKRGHCEYFAGAMALMCQSLGMQARVVVGFKCDEYNNVGGYYQVRQSHAHAWVEVLTTSGVWKTFDPTSARDSAGQRAMGMWTRMKHVFDFLEFKWANSVVAYDGDSRDNLLERANNRLTNAGIQSNQKLADLQKWLDGAEFFALSSRMLFGLVVFMIFALFVAIGLFLIERWRMHRRAARIGLDALPAADQLRLARQLGFYADLMLLLERQRITRPRSQTPMEFARSLTFLPADVYRSVCRLTRIFYRVRFGDAQLTPAFRRKLDGAIVRLSEAFGAAR